MNILSLKTNLKKKKKKTFLFSMFYLHFLRFYLSEPIY